MEASEFDFPDATLDLLSEVFSKRIHSIFEESITPIPNILRSTLPRDLRGSAIKVFIFSITITDQILTGRPWFENLTTE